MGGQGETYSAASEAAAKLRRTKISLGVMTAYGSGALEDTITGTALETFLLFYLTAVCGLTNSLAGLSLFLGLTLDALADPLVGSMSDNTSSRLGRRHPFMFASAIPLAVTFVLLFSIPVGLLGWGLFAYVTVVSIAHRICHSLYNLPYVALGAELSDDYHQRTAVVAMRFLFNVIGVAACVTLGTKVFMSGPQGLLHRSAYRPFGLSCAALILLGAFTASFGTLGALGRLHLGVKRPGSAITRLIGDIAEILRNRSFLALFASLLLVFVGAGVSRALSLHVYKFFWNLPPNVITLLLLTQAMGALIAVTAGMALIHRFEKRTVVIAGLVAYCAQLIIPPSLTILGLLPRSGVVLYGVLIFGGIAAAGFGTAMGIAFQSAMADAADEHELLFGTRREGLFYAGLNFSSKAAVGLGGLIAGLGLDLVRFPTNIAAHPGAAVRIDAETARNLGLLYGPAPSVLVLGAIVAVLGYPLTKRAHERIQAQLGARREARRLETASDAEAGLADLEQTPIWIAPGATAQ